MPAQQIRRMPLSCENCRRRKVRCLGTSVPCETCLRRGRESSCHFLKHDNLRVAGSSRPYDHEDLVGRITQLEQLLQHQTALSRATTDEPSRVNPSRSVESCSASSGRAGEYEDSGYDEHDEQTCKGRIVKDARGYLRFVSSEYATSPDAELLDQLRTPGSSTDSSKSTFSSCFTDQSGSRQQLFDLLPPVSQCDTLKTVFFEVFSPLFHVLHHPSFDREYQRFKVNAEDAPLAFLALLFIIIAIATSALPDDHPVLQDLGREGKPYARIRRLTTKYQSAAMRCLAIDNFLWQHNMFTLQALILIIYSLSHTTGPAWSLLGATFNIAVAIGCHVDPSQLAGGLTPVESEERRRCWAALMMLHTIQNTCLGNIAPVTIVSAVQLPADVEDEDLSNDRASRMTADRPISISKMSYILHKFKLYELAAEICQLTPLKSASSANKVTLLHDRLVAEQDIQRSKFSGIIDLPRCHRAHGHILSIYTNHLFLILHRPFLKSRPDRRFNSTTYQHETKVIKALRQCLHSSTKILQNYIIMCKEPQFTPYRWYTSGLGAFHALLAASTLIVTVSHPLLDQDELSSIDVKALLHDCLLQFEDGAKRSQACARGLHFLGNVLRSVIQTPAAGTDSRTGTHAASLSLTQASPNTPNHISAEDGGRVQPLHETPSKSSWTAQFAEPYHQQQPRFDDYADVDFGGWTVPQHLVNLVSDGPSQQWLNPSAFAWETWIPSTDNNVHFVLPSDPVMASAEMPLGMQVF